MCMIKYIFLEVIMTCYMNENIMFAVHLVMFMYET